MTANTAVRSNMGTSTGSHAQNASPQEARPPRSTPRAAPLPAAGPHMRGRAFPTQNPECIVCCRPIEKANCERESWKSYYQPLSLDKNTNELPPAQKYQPRRGQVHVHACCWEIAHNVLDLQTIDEPFLTDFSLHLFNLKPFADATPFDCETNDVDHELWAEPQPESGLDNAADYECRGILSLSALAEISCWLDQNPKTMTIDEVRKIDKCLAYCLVRGMPYSLASNKDMNVRPNLMRALQNLRTSDASRLPKTYNLRAAWDNVQAAVDAMMNSPSPQVMRPVPGLNASARIIKFCIPTEKCHRLTFSFTRMQIQPFTQQPSAFFSGFGYDGKSLGRWGENHTHTVQSLHGVHLVRDSLVGFTAIRVKNIKKWGEWFGATGDGADDIELEWETKKYLIFHFDDHGYQHQVTGVRPTCLIHRYLIVTMAEKEAWEILCNSRTSDSVSTEYSKVELKPVGGDRARALNLANIPG